MPSSLVRSAIGGGCSRQHPKRCSRSRVQRRWRWQAGRRRRLRGRLALHHVAVRERQLGAAGGPDHGHLEGPQGWAGWAGRAGPRGPARAPSRRPPRLWRRRGRGGGNGGLACGLGLFGRGGRLARRSGGSPPAPRAGLVFLCSLLSLSPPPPPPHTTSSHSFSPSTLLLQVSALLGSSPPRLPSPSPLVAPPPFFRSVFALPLSPPHRCWRAYGKVSTVHRC